MLSLIFNTYLLFYFISELQYLPQSKSYIFIELYHKVLF